MKNIKEKKEIKEDQETSETIATSVLHLMKRSLIRVYILLIIFIFLFVISIVDSFYQRKIIIEIIKERQESNIVEYCETNANCICEKSE